MILLILWLALLLLFQPISSQNPKSSTTNETANVTTAKSPAQDEVDILPTPYYRDVAPVYEGTPVEVHVSVVVLNMKLSSGSTQYFDVDIFYHNYWNDHRLLKPSSVDSIAQRFSPSPGEDTLPQYKLNHNWRNKLWIPDTYFRNGEAGSVSNILTPTHYFTVTNYTQIFMAVRLQLKLTCDMNFYNFPFDTQKCFINITTTSEDSQTLTLKWLMFRIGSHVDVSEFSIVSIDKKECLKYLDIGSFSCLYGEIVFKRNIGNYMIKRFIPSIVIVLMTFVGFWIPTSISPARTALPITSLLALITQQIQSDLNVSYVYALQIWNIVCIMFVFASLVEFSIALYVMYLSQLQQQQQSTKPNESKRLNSAIEQLSSGIRMEILSPSANNGDNHANNISLNNTTTVKGQSIWRRYIRPLRSKLYEHFRSNSRHSGVDLISRYLFPFAFGSFVITFSILFYM